MYFLNVTNHITIRRNHIGVKDEGSLEKSDCKTIQWQACYSHWPFSSQTFVHPFFIPTCQCSPLYNASTDCIYMIEEKKSTKMSFVDIKTRFSDFKHCNSYIPFIFATIRFIEPIVIYTPYSDKYELLNAEPHFIGQHYFVFTIQKLTSHMYFNVATTSKVITPAFKQRFAWNFLQNARD